MGSRKTRSRRPRTRQACLAVCQLRLFRECNRQIPDERMIQFIADESQAAERRFRENPNDLQIIQECDEFAFQMVFSLGLTDSPGSADAIKSSSLRDAFDRRGPATGEPPFLFRHLLGYPLQETVLSRYLKLERHFDGNVPVEKTIAFIEDESEAVRIQLQNPDVDARALQEQGSEFFQYLLFGVVENGAEVISSLQRSKLMRAISQRWRAEPPLLFQKFADTGGVRQSASRKQLSQSAVRQTNALLEFGDSRQGRKDFFCVYPTGVAHNVFRPDMDDSQHRLALDQTESIFQDLCLHNGMVILQYQSPVLDKYVINGFKLSKSGVQKMRPDLVRKEFLALLRIRPENSRPDILRDKAYMYREAEIRFR